MKFLSQLLKKPPHSFPKQLYQILLPKKVLRVLISPHPHQHLSTFFITAILMELKKYLTVVLICISLMTNVEQLVICLLVISHYFILFGDCLFKYLAYFSVMLFVFLLLNSSNILDTTPLSNK